MENIIIEPIDIEDVIKYDKDRFNSNNHWINNIKPIDYNERSEMTKTKNWIHLFRNEYKVIKINNQYHIGWMKKASEISQQTGKFSKIFEDELDEFVKFFYKNYGDILSEKNEIPYFVRCEKFSLKYGEHKTGPYYGIKEIIESLVSSIKTHSPINSITTELVLYLIPFNDKINNFNEWRVFVNNNKITSISQQSLYNKFDTNLIDNINTYGNFIVNYFENTIKNKIIWINSYSYDFVIITEENGELEPYFIELNGFGAEYPAGSGLFHWIHDRDKLYGLNSNIYLRYTY